MVPKVRAMEPQLGMLHVSIKFMKCTSNTCCLVTALTRPWSGNFVEHVVEQRSEPRTKTFDCSRGSVQKTRVTASHSWNQTSSRWRWFSIMWNPAREAVTYFVSSAKLIELSSRTFTSRFFFFSPSFVSQWTQTFFCRCQKEEVPR